MCQPLISIIIPVYKVEKYLPRCIESVLNQTYKNFELILVDDGSPDNSGKICDEYALKDNRIKVIHKENGGVSSARNAGVDVVTGKYINFVDSDDWVPNNSLKSLYDAIIESNADLSIGGYENRGKRIKIIKYESEEIDFTSISDKQIIDVVNRTCMYGPCCKLYKSELIKNNRVFFNQNIKLGEDTLFVRNYLMYINKIQICNDLVYYYNTLNIGSATRKYYSELSNWSLILLKEYQKLLNAHIKDDKFKLKALSEYALKRYVYTATFYCANCTKNVAINNLIKTNKLLLPYLSLNNDWVYVIDKLNNVRKAIYHNDFVKIYKCLKSNKLLNFIKTVNRKFYFKFIASKTERKRDGLI